MCDSAQLLDWQDRSHFVVGHHDSDKDSIVCDGFLQLLRRKPPISIHFEISDAVTKLLQELACTQDGWVLDSALASLMGRQRRAGDSRHLFFTRGKAQAHMFLRDRPQAGYATATFLLF